MMNDEVKAAVDRLKAMDSVVIEQFDPDNAIWCDIRLVLAARLFLLFEREWKVINSEADLPSEAGWYVVRYNGDWTDAIAHFDPLHHQWWNERPIKAYIPEPIPEFKEVTVK